MPDSYKSWALNLLWLYHPSLIFPGCECRQGLTAMNITSDRFFFFEVRRTCTSSPALMYLIPNWGVLGNALAINPKLFMQSLLKRCYLRTIFKKSFKFLTSPFYPYLILIQLVLSGGSTESEVLSKTFKLSLLSRTIKISLSFCDVHKVSYRKPVINKLDTSFYPSLGPFLDWWMNWWVLGTVLGSKNMSTECVSAVKECTD